MIRETSSMPGHMPPLGSLEDYLESRGALVSEGHIALNPKKLNIFASLIRDNKQIRSIGEIGFNAGHSSELFLSTNPSCTVVSFDIMEHSYAKEGKTYIDLKYPGRHTLIEGDSLATVPEFTRLHPETRFDLIFIDGDHGFLYAYNDIVNMQRCASSTTILIVDDTNYGAVSQALNKCLLERRVRVKKKYNIKGEEWIVGSYVSSIPPRSTET